MKNNRPPEEYFHEDNIKLKGITLKQKTKILFNLCLDLKVKKSIEAVLHKKGDITEPENYRRVGLLNLLC